jgi:hypothetical protein
MASTNKVLIKIDEETTELKGAEKETFLVDVESARQEYVLLEAKEAEKKQSRESAIKKLAEIAGLTEEELSAIL